MSSCDSQRILDHTCMQIYAYLYIQHAHTHEIYMCIYIYLNIRIYWYILIRTVIHVPITILPHPISLLTLTTDLYSGESGCWSLMIGKIWSQVQGDMTHDKNRPYQWFVGKQGIQQSWTDIYHLCQIWVSTWILQACLKRFQLSCCHRSQPISQRAPSQFQRANNTAAEHWRPEVLGDVPSVKNPMVNDLDCEFGDKRMNVHRLLFVSECFCERSFIRVTHVPSEDLVLNTTLSQALEQLCRHNEMTLILRLLCPPTLLHKKRAILSFGIAWLPVCWISGWISSTTKSPSCLKVWVSSKSYESCT